MKKVIHLFVMLLLAVNLSAQAGGALTATIKNAINDCKNGCIDL